MESKKRYWFTDEYGNNIENDYIGNEETQSKKHRNSQISIKVTSM